MPTLPLEIDHELKESCVDWLTCTSSDAKGSELLGPTAARLFALEKRSGNVMLPWGMSGFAGWKCGHVQSGVRGDEVIVRVGGSVAAEHWSKLHKLASNVSRIDLQVTTRTSVTAGKRILQHYREASRWSNRRNSPLTVSMFHCNDGSRTLYLGRRSSNVMARIYDKGRESKLECYDDHVRYEVELKGERAQSVATALAASGSQSLWVSGYVRGFLEKRGCRRLWKQSVPFHRSPVALGDFDRRLRWIANSVRPSWLLAVSMGEEERFLRALGIVKEPACG